MALSQTNFCIYAYSENKVEGKRQRADGRRRIKTQIPNFSKEVGDITLTLLPTKFPRSSIVDYRHCDQQQVFLGVDP